METLGWIRKLDYLGHSIGGADKLISLDPDELIGIAKSTTNLSDFGDDNWRADFYEEVKSLNSSESLHILGRLQVRASLLRCLRNRLFVTNKIKSQPEILREPIDSPVIITGLPRTGTTHLFELLSQDSSFRAPFCFEAVSPVEPPPDTLTGNIDRKNIAQCCFDFKNDLFPELKAMHIHQHDLPEECRVITESILGRMQYVSDFTGDYQSWIEGVNGDYIYHWHKIILQLLQYKHPKKEWLLKCPTHINHMEQIVEYYPNARIIHTHRDPAKALPSLLSIANVEGAATFTLDTDDIEKYSSAMLALFEGGLRKVISQRQETIVPEKQIFDIHMSDLISDPMAVIRAAYNHLDMEFSEALEKRILNYLAENRRNKHGKHTYRPQNFGLTEERIREQFRFYTDHYNIALNT